MIISLWYCDRQTVKRQLRDRQTVKIETGQRVRQWVVLLHTKLTGGIAGHICHPGGKKKENHCKAQLKFEKMNLFLFLFISSLHSYFFISFPYGKKNNHITGMYCLKYWVLFWFFCRKYDNFSQILEKRTEKVIFLDHNFFKNIS